MPELLDQSEIDALMDAVDSGDVAEDSGDVQIFSAHRRGFEGIEIREYDFKRPERISKDQMLALHTLHETFARNFGAALSGYLRTIIEVRVVHTEQMTYGEFISSLPNPTSFNLIAPEPLEGQFCLEISPLIIYPIIDRLMGGNNDDLFIPQRPITMIEQRLIQRILDRGCTALAESWENVHELSFSVAAMESNPHIMQIVPPNEVVVVIGFELKLASRAGTMTMCLPFNVIEPVMEAVSSQSWFLSGQHRGEKDYQRRIEHNLGDAAVDVSGVLAETEITIEQLRGLEVGDIIMTEKPASDPVLLSIEGVPKFHANIGQFKGRRALKITRRVKPGDRL